MNVKNILIGTDFSECSETAISFALAMAKKLGADLHIMHSMTSTFSITLGRILERLITEEQFREVKVNTITEIGDPGSSILRQIKEVKADLVVMGSKGKSGARKFMGSTTTEVISKSGVPILAIPENSSYSGLGDIVFMTDFNEGDLSALKEILQWARYFKAQLHVLHLFTEDSLQELIKFRGFKEVAKETIEYEKLSFERIFNPSFDEGFFNYLDTRSPQLVVLTRYKKTFFQKLRETDHTRNIGFESIVPLLVLPAEQYVEKQLKDSTLKQQI